MMNVPFSLAMKAYLVFWGSSLVLTICQWCNGIPAQV
jgi:hypothetical protein